MAHKQGPSKSVATMIGASGLIMWAFAALYTVIVNSIPTFEILSLVLSFSFTITAIKLTLCKQWRTILQPWPIWLIGIVGIYGNDLLYIAAFKRAPAVQADLINYLWPLFVVVFAGVLPKEKFTFKHIFAATLGLLGTFLVVTEGEGLAGFQMQYASGYTLALFDAIVWSVYTLAARHYSKTPVEMMGMYCGVGALISISIHVHSETFVVPHLSQWLALLAMGLTTQGLAYFFWDFGVKKGNFKLLGVLSYANPIVSVALLVLFGMASLTTSLLIASVLVTLAGLIAGYQGQWPLLSKSYQWLQSWLTQSTTSPVHVTPLSNKPKVG